MISSLAASVRRSMPYELCSTFRSAAPARPTTSRARSILDVSPPNRRVACSRFSRRVSSLTTVGRWPMRPILRRIPYTSDVPSDAPRTRPLPMSGAMRVARSRRNVVFPNRSDQRFRGPRRCRWTSSARARWSGHRARHQHPRVRRGCPPGESHWVPGQTQVARGCY